MASSGARPDFPPRGSLTLKAWMANDQGITLPAALALPTVTAPAPYAEQIATVNAQVGAVIARQNMKDKSGASVMDPKTQVTSVHGHSVLELALQPLQANFALPLVHASWITALVFTVLNAGLLAVRIKVEDEALASLPNSGHDRTVDA